MSALWLLSYKISVHQLNVHLSSNLTQTPSNPTQPQLPPNPTNFYIINVSKSRDSRKPNSKLCFSKVFSLTGMIDRMATFSSGCMDCMMNLWLLWHIRAVWGQHMNRRASDWWFGWSFLTGYNFFSFGYNLFFLFIYLIVFDICTRTLLQDAITITGKQ